MRGDGGGSRPSFPGTQPGTPGSTSARARAQALRGSGERAPKQLRSRAVAAHALIAATLAIIAGEARAAGPHFEHMDAESGLRSEIVTTIYQDRTGFIWLGSRDGLTLYDGYSSSLFEHDASDPTSISDNAIRAIYQDRRGYLWVGTNTGGLDRLDLATRRFQHFRRDDSDAGSLSYNSVYAIVEDIEGDLWVGTQRGLNRFDPATGKFQRFLAEPGRPGTIGSDYVYCLFVDKQGRLWAGTVGGGLGLYDRGTGRFTVYRHNAAEPTSLGDDSVFALLEDFEGNILVGTSTGLDIMDPKTGQFRHFRSDPKDSASLSHPIVTSLAPGPTGRVWVGTFGGGLNEFDPSAGRFRAFRSESQGRAGPGDDKVTCLMNDHDATLWIGTWGGGLSRLRRSALLFSSASTEPPAPSDLADNDVTGLGRNSTDSLWVGTATGDLLKLEAARGAWRRYLKPSDLAVLCIVPVRDGHVWVGSEKGLYRLDPATGQAASFSHNPGDDASLGPGYVKAFLEDREGRLWVGTGEGGLQRLGTDGAVIERFLPRANDPSSVSDEYVTALLEDRRGTLWVGTRSGGLNAFDPSSRRFVRYEPEPGLADTLSHHNVTSILEDSKGRLWVATAGGGLNRVLDPAADGRVRFVRLTTSDGLIDNNVMGVLEDEDGSLWLSTKRGLSRFDPQSGAFANYTTADGLPSVEFESGSAVRSGRTLYFGSVKWLSAVPMGTPFPGHAPSPTVVTSIRAPSGELRGAEPAWRMDQAAIPYGRWISIELAVLDYSTEHRHAYSYRLGDSRAAWVDLGTRRVITVTDLAPGTYTFEAKGRNDQGVWTTVSPTLRIRVVPPFWMTVWFRVLVALALVALAFVVHRVRLSALERRTRELIRLHDQREVAREELRRAYNRLRFLARQLEVAKEEERKSIARELHDDLGPALTAVVINLQLLKDAPDAAKAARRITDTVEIVDRMVQRIRDLSLDLRPPLLDEMGLVAALKGYLETQAERSGIEIEVRGTSSVQGLPPEFEIVAFRVVQEAVTNVLRHAGARRAVVTIERQQRWLDIAIEDEGRGFEVKSTLEGPATGKILGLLGMQERVRMLDGEFEIESAPGQGCRVHARLPLGAGS